MEKRFLKTTSVVEAPVEVPVTTARTMVDTRAVVAVAVIDNKTAIDFKREVLRGYYDIGEKRTQKDPIISTMVVNYFPYCLSP